MPLAPIEIVTLVFPGNEFNGEVLPQLGALVENETITIIDGLFVGVDESGDISFTEIDELGGNTEAAALTGLIERFDELISEDDVTELAAELPPNSSAAILVFQHTWIKPLRDAIVASGGLLLDSIRVPGAVVEEVLDAVAELDSQEQK